MPKVCIMIKLQKEYNFNVVDPKEMLIRCPACDQKTINPNVDYCPMCKTPIIWEDENHGLMIDGFKGKIYKATHETAIKTGIPAHLVGWKESENNDLMSGPEMNEKRDRSDG